MTKLVNFSSYIEKEELKFTGNLSMLCKIIRQTNLALIYHCTLSINFSSYIKLKS